MTRTRDHIAPVELPAPVGTVVDGYRIDRIISVRVGLHTVAAATAPSGDRVTLKLLAKAPEDKEVRRRLAKLSPVRASIQHPNMLPLVPKACAKQRLCLAGAPADAVTLADRLRDGPLPPKTAVALMSQVAGALETACQRGVTHRELSPAAILVTAEDPPQALLTDFGLADPDAPGCHLPAAVEDADYRSPEEIRGEPPRSESCVYSLACILIACLTGSPPYPYDRPLLALHAHLVEPPPRPTELNPDLPREFDGVVARAMAKDPVQRYRLPGAFMRAVQEALGIEARIPVTRATESRRASPTPTQAPPKQPTQTPGQEPVRTPAQAAIAAPEPSVPKAARRGPRRAPRARPPRLGAGALARRLAPTWIGIALLASALAGFATGNEDADGGVAPAPAQESAPRGIASVPPTVRPLMARLDERRTAARQRLRAAKLPARQAAFATQLAAIYGDAHASLMKSQQGAQSNRLAEQLQAVEKSYRALAQAAKQGSARGWQRAGDRVRKREQDFELLLRTQRWP